MNKEEIPGSKRSMHGNILTDLLQALKGEPLSSVFSSGGTLISASAAPHCSERMQNTSRLLVLSVRTPVFIIA